MLTVTFVLVIFEIDGFSLTNIVNTAVTCYITSLREFCIIYSSLDVIIQNVLAERQTTLIPVSFSPSSSSITAKTNFFPHIFIIR